MRDATETEILLLEELRSLRVEVADLKATCDRMDRHITFVESVYEAVRQPLQYLSGIFYRIPPAPTASVAAPERAITYT